MKEYVLLEEHKMNNFSNFLDIHIGVPFSYILLLPKGEKVRFEVEQISSNLLS